MAIRKRILFCFYPLFVAYNHGIALLSALCRQNGIETGLLVLDTLDRLRDRIQFFNPDYVGFSCVTKHDFRRTLPFIRLAKDHGQKVIMGGHYFQMTGSRPAESDLVCFGEAETLPAFILHGDDSLFQDRLICQNINALPLPDYDLFEGIPFDRGLPFLEGKRVLPYFSSRGCPWSCSFCDARHTRLRIRFQVAGDLAYLKDRYQPDIFWLGDATLPYYSREWRESWLDFRHPFFAYIRADISPGLLDWLIDRGLIGCAFGVESGDEEYRNTQLNKRLLDKDIDRVTRILKERGISYIPFFMSGTPGETFRIKAKTWEMSQNIGGYPIIFQWEKD